MASKVYPAGLKYLTDGTTSYTSDTNPADGFLDASSLLWFRPLAQDGRVARVDNGPADCLAPAPTSGCAPRAGTEPTAYTYAAAAPDRALRFPADHGPHREAAIEWWYFTGHILTAPAPVFWNVTKKGG